MFSKIKWNNYINYLVVTALLILFSIFSMTGSLKGSTAILLESISIAVILAVSLNIVVGFLGELSLGHAGFMCVGAYIGGKIASVMDADANNHFAILLSILVGGVVAAVCGFIIGLPALRLKGDYLAIVTLAFGEIVRVIFLNTGKESFGGELGLKTPRYDREYMFIYGFVFVLICLAVLQNIIRSKHGRAITAIRDNEIAAHATGINVTKYKLIAFIISAFFAGIAGVLYSHTHYRITTEVFDYNYSIEILIMVVIGGMGSINGSMIAAVLITVLNNKLSTILTGETAIFQNLIYALILVVIVIYNNAPKLKPFREKYNFKNLVSKIPKPKWVKHHYANDEGKWDRVPTKIEMNEVLSTDFVVKESTKNPDRKGGDE